MVHAKRASIEFIGNCALEAKAPIHPDTLSLAYLKNRPLSGKLGEGDIWLKLKTGIGECILHPRDG